jgi:uncharacterized protein
MHEINKDHDRFRQIIKGSVRKELKKLITQSGILGRRGKKTVSIPLPKINLPRFTWKGDGGGVGQGGDQGPPGDDPADNQLEVEVELEELADLLGEELELPLIKPKGESQLTVESHKYNTLRKLGPESLLHFKRTYKEALIRAIVSEEYDPDNPTIIPIKEDKRYRASTPIYLPNNQAVVFYVMDVSGSMREEEKRLARLISFWIDLWLRRNYKNIVSKYIIHNVTAREVDQNTFYRTKEGGGTRIASAYELVHDMLRVEYSPSDWNSYVFQYSDGDDFDYGKGTAIDAMRKVVSLVNQVAYCQVNSRGKFLAEVKKAFSDEESVVWAEADDEELILSAIKEFFHQGR